MNNLYQTARQQGASCQQQTYSFGDHNLFTSAEMWKQETYTRKNQYFTEQVEKISLQSLLYFYFSQLNMQELSYNAYTRKNMQAKANHSSMVWKLQRTSSNLKKKKCKVVMFTMFTNVHMFTNEAEKNKNLLNFLQILGKP